MFRLRQTLNLSSPHLILIRAPKVLESGVIESVISDASDMVLPPVENFDLDAMIKAGVPLKQVNCKLIAPSAVSLPEAAVQSTEQKEN